MTKLLGKYTSNEQAIIEGAQQFNVLTLVDANGNERQVEPYLLYTPGGKHLLHCFQVAGYSSSDQVIGWKNIDLMKVAEVLPTSQKFIIRGDFNPGNSRFKGLVIWELETRIEFPNVLELKNSAD